MYIALGCLIKGETSHYDLICTAVTNGLMGLTINENLPLGFGILTCDNKKQAIERANPNKKNNEIERNICDYVSGMTDRYASRLYSSIYE